MKQLFTNGCFSESLLNEILIQNFLTFHSILLFVGLCAGKCLQQFSNLNITGINAFLVVHRHFHCFQLFIGKHDRWEKMLNNGSVNEQMGSDGFVITVSIDDTISCQFTRLDKLINIMKSAISKYCTKCP